MSQMKGIFADSNVLADYVVDYCAKTLRNPVTNLQLQKVLFFMEYFYRAEKGRFLFEENFVAWPYGPVLASVYDRYKQHGAHWIWTANSSGDISSYNVDKDYINKSINILSNINAYELVSESHRSGGAWHRTEYFGHEINREYIDQDINNNFYFQNRQ